MYNLDEKVLADNRSLITINYNKEMIKKALKDGTLNYTVSDNELFVTIPTSKDLGEYNRIIQEKPNGKIGKDLTFEGSIIIEKDLVVLGDNTSIEVGNLTVEDNIIEINKGEKGNGITLGTAGVKIKRGLQADSEIIYDEGLKSVGGFTFKLGDSNVLSSLSNGDLHVLRDLFAKNVTFQNISADNINIANKTTTNQLLVNGAASFQDTVLINKKLTANEVVEVKGDTNLRSNLTIDKNLNVVGATTLTGVLTANNTINANGNIVAKENISITKKVTANISEVSTLSKTNTLEVTNGATVGTNLTVAQKIIAQNATINNDLEVKRNATISGDASIGNNLSVVNSISSNLLDVNTASIDTLNSTNSTINTSTITNLSVLNDANFTKKIVANDLEIKNLADIMTLKVKSNGTVGMDLSIGKDLSVVGNSTVAKNSTVNGTLTVEGISTLKGRINVSNDIYNGANKYIHQGHFGHTKGIVADKLDDKHLSEILPIQGPLALLDTLPATGSRQFFVPDDDSKLFYDKNGKWVNVGMPDSIDWEIIVNKPELITKVHTEERNIVAIQNQKVFDITDTKFNPEKDFIIIYKNTTFLPKVEYDVVVDNNISTPTATVNLKSTVTVKEKDLISIVVFKSAIVKGFEDLKVDAADIKSFPNSTVQHDLTFLKTQVENIDSILNYTTQDDMNNIFNTFN